MRRATHILVLHEPFASQFQSLWVSDLHRKDKERAQKNISFGATKAQSKQHKARRGRGNYMQRLEGAQAKTTFFSVSVCVKCPCRESMRKTQMQKEAFGRTKGRNDCTYLAAQRTLFLLHARVLYILTC